MDSHERDKNQEENYDKVQTYFRKNQKLPTFDWLEHIDHDSDIVEIAFKNTRKAFFLNTYKLPVKKGDIVAVEAHTGHDIGVVSLTGILAEKQFNRKIRKKNKYKFMRIWRKASENDLQKFLEAKTHEIPVRNRARLYAKEMGIEMKISDVEMQGDGTKAIFYYLAEGRIDFRELIKVFAREFKLKIEMKQIGSRQEAALIGGIDLSGREFCGSTWKTEFESVKSNAAKIQQLPLNDSKLMDHSGNLKNCLLYELDTYLEAWEEFPDKIPALETSSGKYYPHKVDVLKREIWYSLSEDKVSDPVIVPLKRVKRIMELNEKGEKPPISEGEYSRLPEQKFSVGSMETQDLQKRSKSGNKSKKKKKSKKNRKKTFS